jgi:hypothetical protein
MMAELSEEAKAEIAAAVRILRDDGVHIHKSYPAFAKAQADKDTADKNAPTDGKPPPVKDNPEIEYDEVATLWGTKRVKKAKPDAGSQG